MKVVSCLCCLFLCWGSPSAQTSLSGTITDAGTGEPIIFGSVALYQNGKLVTGTESDFDGHYSFKTIDPGTYLVEVTYVGYLANKISDVKVLAGKSNKLDIQITVGNVNLDVVVVKSYKIPLIQQDNTTSGTVITSRDIRSISTGSYRSKRSKKTGSNRKQKANNVASGSVVSSQDIRNLPTRNINSLAASTAGLSRSDQGKGVTIRGSRTNETPSDQEGSSVIIENKVVLAKEEAISTFSIDVDRAAYSQVRSYLQRQQMPPANLVRTEELINYFDYEYPQPTGKHPFSVSTELGICPWEETHQLLQIGIQGENLNLQEAPANNLVFLIDVSGSMTADNKLPLVKKAIAVLVAKLRPEDRVAMVVYAGAAGLVLPATAGQDKDQINAALDQLRSGGSTAGGKGIQLAYQIAQENFLEGGNNRIVLATDGDFNVGVSSNEELEKLIEKERKKGIYLTVLGFGMGNYKDNRLELLADKGNGNYAYIDNIMEARKVFDTELTGTLYTIAKDVKLQLEFDEKRVKSYRLIGYENRLLEKEDFEDDQKDAGELGAGHTVTAFYELELIDGKEPIAAFRLRYKRPNGSQSYLLTHDLPATVKKLEACSENFRFAASVAAFSALLRNSVNKGNLTFEELLSMARGAQGDDAYAYRQEFINLVQTARDLALVADK